MMQTLPISQKKNSSQQPIGITVRWKLIFPNSTKYVYEVIQILIREDCGSKPDDIVSILPQTDLEQYIYKHW